MELKFLENIQVELEFFENIQAELKFLENIKVELEVQLFFFCKSHFAITRLSKNRVLHLKLDF